MSTQAPRDQASNAQAEDPSAYEFLLTDVARQYKTLFNRRFQPLLGLTQAQSRTLIHLNRNEGINQAGLAELLEIQPITLARAIDRLEADGWVERRADPKDRRAFTLHLLPKAQPALDEMRELALSLREQTLNHLSDEERQAFVKALAIIQNNITGLETVRNKTLPNKESAANAVQLEEEPTP
jgi:DNA-binding MarR family transcriptional regulator